MISSDLNILSGHKRFFLLFILMLACASLFAGEGYSLIGRPHFIPDNYYIGDEVVCRLIIRTEPGVELYRDPALKLPDRPELVVEELNIYPGTGNQTVVEITFIPFYPQLRIPQLDLGDVILDEIVINTFSILDEGGSDFEPLRSQVYLPYTRELVLVFIFFLLLIPVIFLSASDRFRKRLMARIALRRRVRPYARISGLIRELGESAGVVSPKVFYTRLTQALRSYLSDVTGIDYISITTGEIAAGLKRTFDDPRIAESVQEVMQFADEIKFSGKRAARAHQRRDLVRLRRTITLVEKEMARIRQQEEEERRQNKRKGGGK